MRNRPLTTQSKIKSLEYSFPLALNKKLVSYIQYIFLLLSRAYFVPIVQVVPDLYPLVY